MSNVQVATPDEMRDPKLPSINQQLARLAIPEPTRESTGHGKDFAKFSLLLLQIASSFLQTCCFSAFVMISLSSLMVFASIYLCCGS